MIQRVQSVYLFVAMLVSAGLPFIFELWSYSGTFFYAPKFIFNKPDMYFAISVLFFVSAFLSALSIFLFKNRKRQLFAGKFNILINLLLLGLLIYLSQTLSGEALTSKKGIGMFLPLATILLLFLANRAIKKDENLVKSVDRLR